MAGVTVDGYELKTLAEINTEASADLDLIVDPVTGENFASDLSDASDVVTQLTAITLEGVADGLLVDQAAYNQFDPSKATGDALSTLSVINGINRKGSTASTADLTFTGTPLATIPSTENIEVTDSIQDNIWLVTEDIVFDGGGLATNVPATNQTLGAITAAANTLDQLVLTNADIDTVTNPSAAIVGNDVESDPALRQRRDRSTQAPAVGLVGSIFSAIGNVEGVTQVRVYNNVDIATDSDGIPGKTMAAVVVGGVDEAIAQVIFSRNGSASTIGNTTVFFQDNQGFTTAVNFFRPTPVPIYVEVTISLLEDDDAFPANGEDQIKQAIVDYSVNGALALGITEGFDQTGFPPGSDVLVSRLFTPINSVPGHTIETVFIGIAPSPTLQDDIIIPFNEVSDFQVANIVVNL